MVTVLGISEVTLSIIIGVLAAIVYSLRVLVLMDRKIARVENHIEKIATSILKEEAKIEHMLSKKKPKSRKKKRR